MTARNTARSVWAPPLLSRVETRGQRVRRLVREWNAFEAAGFGGEPREVVLRWTDVDADLFLEAYRLKLEMGAAGVPA